MLDRWLRMVFPDAETRAHRRAVREALERFVTQTDPRARAIPRYRGRLEAPMRSALAYVDAVAARVPGPMDFDGARWMADPLVRAFFSSVEALRATFSRVRDLRRFFATHAEASHVYCLLAATLETRTVFVVREVDGGPPRELAARSVTFAEPMMIFPSATEVELRRQIARLAFNGLVRAAVLLRERVEAAQKSLEEERAQLRLRCQIARRQGRCLDTLVAGGEEASTDDTLQAALVEVESGMVAARRSSTGPAAALDRLVAVLERPEAHTYLRELSFRLDRMNLDVPGGSDGEPVRLVQAAGPRGTRVAMIARYARADLLPEEGLYADMHAVLRDP